jgi:hypothetical protein
MIVGIVGSLFAYLILARPSAERTIEPSTTDRGVPVVHQYLVVANHTLGGQELLDAIHDRMSRGPAEFWVLVPATPTIHLINDFNALSCAFPVELDVLPSARTRDEGIADAKSNLDTELHRLREIGATADGAVGDPDPMKAIESPPPNGDSTRSSSQRCRPESPDGSPGTSHIVSEPEPMFR